MMWRFQIPSHFKLKTYSLGVCFIAGVGLSPFIAHAQSARQVLDRAQELSVEMNAQEEAVIQDRSYWSITISKTPFHASRCAASPAALPGAAAKIASSIGASCLSVVLSNRSIRLMVIFHAIKKARQRSVLRGNADSD